MRKRPRRHAILYFSAPSRQLFSEWTTPPIERINGHPVSLENTKIQKHRRPRYNHPAQAGGAGYWEHSWSYFSLFCQGRLCFCFKFRPLVIQWGFQERFDSISQLKAGKTESWKRYKCLVIYGGLRIRIPIPIHCTWSMSSPGAVSKFILFRLIIPFVLQLQVFFALPCLALPCFVSLPQGFCGVTALSKSAVAKTSSWLNDSILCPPTHESWRILGEHIAQHMQFCQNSRTRLAAGK